MKNFSSLVKSWLPLGIGITLISAMIYGTVQQNYRSEANDPQIQIAQDLAAAMAGGAQPQSLVRSYRIDMATSLDPYAIIYDKNLTPLAGDALLNSKAPLPPKGVFEYALKNKQNRVTWQPQRGVRSAIVVIPYQSEKASGFVLAGRSLSEVEAREARLTQHVVLGWGVTILATLIAVIAL